MLTDMGPFLAIAFFRAFKSPLVTFTKPVILAVLFTLESWQIPSCNENGKERRVKAEKMIWKISTV